MSDFLHAILLGVLQGFTEFLPISSSAHLIFLPKLLGWQDLGLIFDIVIHLGSVLAIIYYFFKHHTVDPSLRTKSIKILGWILFATFPVGLSGLLFKSYVAKYLRNISLLAITNIIFGILLGVGYYRSNRQPAAKYSLADLTWRDACWIGLAQAIAIIPGVSRSGVTLTAAIFLGCDLLLASRVTFLLAIPVIVAAGGQEIIDLVMKNPNLIALDLKILFLGAISSTVSSFIFVHLFFKYIKLLGLYPFVIYRIFLGLFLLLTK